MKDFKKPFGHSARSGGFKKREQSSNFRSERPSFEARSGNKYLGNRDSAAQGEVKHKTECSECHNVCEVPFRPNGKKPVYCTDCFNKKKDGYSNKYENKYENKFEKPSYEKPAFTPRAPEARTQEYKPQPRDTRIDDLAGQVDAMHSKIDRMMKMIESMKTAPTEKTVAAPKTPDVAVKSAAPKKTAKPTAVKKAVKKVISKKKK